MIDAKTRKRLADKCEEMHKFVEGFAKQNHQIPTPASSSSPKAKCRTWGGTGYAPQPPGTYGLVPCTSCWDSFK